MKKALLTTILIAISAWLSAQVVITSADMPQPGDTIRMSITLNLDGISYQDGGEDRTWDFSGLTVMSQQIDTFVSVSATPVIYQAVFNNQFIFPDYKATVARKLAEFLSIPNLELTDTYLFMKNTDEEFREVGVGLTIAGIALPVMYQQIDTIYRFPLQYTSFDSSYSSVEIDVPNLGYFGIDKKRVNIADGWGTLITPYGEFQTLRVRTEIEEYDSLYVDSLNMGFPINRQYTEYKWLANGFSEPLLLVNEENNVVRASYIDSVRTIFTGIKEDMPDQDYNFKVYPNPSSDYISVSYELFSTSVVKISFYSMYGNEVKRIMNTTQGHGLYNQLINVKETGIEPGLYLLVLQIGDQPMVKRVMIQ